MAGTHSAYSARKVIISWANVDISAGKADDAFLTVSRSTPRTSTRAGLDGTHSLAVSPDLSGTITISLFPESDTAKVLQSLYTGMAAAGIAGDILPLDIVDESGAVVVLAPQAILQNMGDLTFGGDTGTVDFEFFVPDLLTIGLPDDLAGQLADARSGLNF
jgi:hypothetical protein